MNTLDKTICNLEEARDLLLRISLSNDNFNSPWSCQFEIMGWDLHKKAQDLKEAKYNNYMELKNV